MCVLKIYAVLWIGGEDRGKKRKKERAPLKRKVDRYILFVALCFSEVELKLYLLKPMLIYSVRVILYLSDMCLKLFVLLFYLSLEMEANLISNWPQYQENICYIL